MSDKTQKYGLGGLLKYSALGMNPLSVLKNRPLTLRTALDPAGLFTDNNYRKKIKQEAARNAGMREGGNVKKAKMEMKHANFMKKKGAPKKMVKEEMKEAAEYRKGGSCKVKKYAKGGGVEIRGKTRGKII